ncbi:hypothetical protein K431DRAFT_316449 [Polychaeton citri CBS 116435]|uniref:Zn(2)-C6 fungal-type domain-containing protein n=1 Tax=Polychaeton citri CBS 116435 TaxID=1314669 RepID=A0A9P4PX60_9PEZI|nr:hypothetical protein K431DRAFT_316449 [Polychaeton citri CBS 116435]
MPKPSFGCKACRQRRVKCDERHGGCLRCERYRIRCPGYQHPFDVLLRHQGRGRAISHGVASTRLDDPRASIQSHDREQHSSSWFSTGLEGTPRASSPRIMRQPSLDFDQAALGAYYSSYCVSSSTVCSLDHIRQQGNGCLWAAIKTLGMMRIHQIRQLPRGCDALLRQYNNATTLVNYALASPSQSREDSTFLGTFLLSIIEMKATSDFSLRYWLVHIKGTAALMELRGADQVLSRLGAALFLQISSHIVICCILGKHCIPCELQSLREKIRPHVIDRDHPLWHWHGLMYRFADFLAAACATGPEAEVRDPKATIREALSIYADMNNIFQSAGSYWSHDTQPSNEFAPLVSHEHVYHSLLAVHVWNERRTAIILLFSVVARVAARCHGCTRLDKDPQLYLKDAHRSIRVTALDTIAAVPQMLAGLKSKGSAHESSSSSNGLRLCDSDSEYDEQVFRQTRQDIATLPYMDSCRIQWPVYFAVQCEFVEPLIRHCLLQVLESSGKALQMQQWQMLAASIRPTLQKPNQALQESINLSN